MSAEHSKGHERSGRRKWLIIAALAAAAIAAVFASRQVVDEGGAQIPTFTVQQGEFVISLELRGGELEAKEAENVVAPRVHGQLKIVELFPEGDQAEVGDLLVLFEQTDFEKRVMDAEQELESAKADLEKAVATQRAEISRLEGDIEDAEANMRLADLQVERMAFEATVEKERTQIEAQKARLTYQQAVEKLESQKVVNSVQVRKSELNISRQERDLAKAQRELASTTIKAEKPGLVVYGKVWKGDRPEKIRVGDEIWGGINVISLPDLSSMQVKTSVNEVDVDKVEVGQRCSIKLDALPEPTFGGEITSIASLGREKEGERNVKVFDIVVAIDEQDERLKPGMTATSTVIIETIPAPPQAPTDSLQQEISEVVVSSEPLPLYVPLDAVFESGGKSVVYRMNNGSPEVTEVTLGKRNENYVIIEAGLEPDDRVALRDPALIADGGGAEGDPSSGTQAQ
jgi:multidrug resistance efflux pump